MILDIDQDHLDDDGYPTEFALEKVKTWDAMDFRGLIEYVISLWRWNQYAQDDGSEVRLATGGWSGNESLIGAMQENRMWWLLHWYQSTRGGAYIFKARGA